MFKKTDELNRSLKRNVYINKVKDVTSFIQLINNIYKTIIGKSGISQFFYKFDRVLSVDISKLANMTFDFVVTLKNIKSNLQMYLEDLYSLLYLFFVNVEVKEVSTQSKDMNHKVRLQVRFNSVEDHKYLIRDILLRIKHIKKIRSVAQNA